MLRKEAGSRPRPRYEKASPCASPGVGIGILSENNDADTRERRQPQRGKQVAGRWKNRGPGRGPRRNARQHRSRMAPPEKIQRAPALRIGICGEEIIQRRLIARHGLTVMRPSTLLCTVPSRRT